MSYIKKNVYSNFVHNVDTSFTKEPISTTIEYYPGTEVTYTPSSDASKVIYEISFYSEASGIPFTAAYLEHYTSGSWSEINARYRKNWGLGGSSSQTHRWPIYWRFVLPSWVGERNLRIRLGQHAANRQINLHKITDWDGSSATDKFCNTNLLVYSI